MQISQVEPENRLVARSLEARAEARLTELAEAEQALQAITVPDDFRPGEPEHVSAAVAVTEHPLVVPGFAELAEVPADDPPHNLREQPGTAPASPESGRTVRIT